LDAQESASAGKIACPARACQSGAVISRQSLLCPNARNRRCGGANSTLDPLYFVDMVSLETGITGLVASIFNQRRPEIR
jgi:hypothetical protein